jgi:putative serine protease PepD
VNGERVTVARPLAVGDAITFGANGPTVEVQQVARAGTDARVAAAVTARTASLQRGAAAAIVASVVLAALAAGAVYRQRTARAPLPAPAARAAATLDLAAISRRNDAAIAMIASDLDGVFLAGTAFGVSPGGRLVTNRHVVRAPSGRAPRRLRVIYANTTDWLPAHVVRTSDADDLALIELDEPAELPHPVVEGVAPASSATHVGAPVASIGFPHAVDTPMEGRGLHVTARTTTTAGTVSKLLDDVLQIDAYAGKGSSGSPVFDAAGHVIGVVYGGAAESNGRIVYAVPAARLRAFIAR